MDKGQYPEAVGGQKNGFKTSTLLVDNPYRFFEFSCYSQVMDRAEQLRMVVLDRLRAFESDLAHFSLVSLSFFGNWLEIY